MTHEKGIWREICEAMVKESDPKRMTELAAQLVAALDERRALADARRKISVDDAQRPKLLLRHESRR